MLITVPNLSYSAFADAMGGKESVVVYGAGLYGGRLASIVRGYGFPVLAFADANPAIWHTTVDGLPVLAPAQAAETYGWSAFFLIALARYSLISEEEVVKDVAGPLAEHGIERIGQVSSLYAMLGRFDCERKGIRGDTDPLIMGDYFLPNFFFNSDASIRNNFGLILSETLLARKMESMDGPYGAAYELPGMTDLRPGDTVADLGANLGVFSACAAGRGCTVHAFERYPKSPPSWNGPPPSTPEKSIFTGSRSVTGKEKAFSPCRT